MCSNILGNEDLLKLLNISLKKFSEYVRGLPEYDANKIVSHLIFPVSIKTKEASLEDIGHFLGTLSSIGIDPVYIYLDKVKDIIGTKIWQSDLNEITEFLLKIYRINRLAAKLVMNELFDHINKKIKLNFDKANILELGKFISSLSKMNCKKGLEAILSVEDKICEAIRESGKGEHSMEYVGAFLYSIGLYCPDNTKYISRICSNEIVSLFMGKFNEADFEELGIFFSGLSKSDKSIIRSIIDKKIVGLLNVIVKRAKTEDLSNIRVLLKGLSLLDKKLAIKIYNHLKSVILEKTRKSNPEKIRRFYEALKKVNTELAEQMAREIHIPQKIR